MSRRRAAAGFTLVEILTAVVIAGLAMGSAASLFKRGFETQNRASELTQAALLAKGVVARMQARGYPHTLLALQRTTDFRPFAEGGGKARNYRWRSEIVTQSPDLEFVDFHIHVVWPWPDHQHELTFPAALAKR